MFPLNLYAHVRFLLMHIAHETAGAARTRSSPRPLLRVACALFFWGGTNLQTSGAVRRENEDSHLVVPVNALVDAHIFSEMATE